MSKLKWLMLPVAAVLLYVIWTQGLPLIGVHLPGAEVDMASPKGVAQAYMNAAVEGAYSEIPALCEPDAAEEADRVAKQINQLEVDRFGVTVKETESEDGDPEVSVYSSMLAGRVAMIELRRDGAHWRVASVVLD